MLLTLSLFEIGISIQVTIIHTYAFLRDERMICKINVNMKTTSLVMDLDHFIIVQIDFNDSQIHKPGKYFQHIFNSFGK